MKSYELILILKADIEKAAFEDEITRVRGAIESSKGTVVGVEDWGKREIAFEIKKYKQGHYVNVRFDSDNSEIVSDLNAVLRISDPVLKFQTHRLSNSERGFRGNPLLMKGKATSAEAGAQ